MIDTQRFYTGIGSRSTPVDIQQCMVNFANSAKSLGWILRSGGADGADSAFEEGAGDYSNIYLPWQSFNKNTSLLYAPSDAAYDMARKVHPNWSVLSKAGRSLMARNMHQVFGADLITPSLLVVCWTPDGCESYETYSIKTGGTGAAISAASRAGIPVFNLANGPVRLNEAYEILNTVVKITRVGDNDHID